MESWMRRRNRFLIDFPHSKSVVMFGHYFSSSSPLCRCFFPRFAFLLWLIIHRNIARGRSINLYPRNIPARIHRHTLSFTTMDLRPCRSHRSPLARLTGNQQNQPNRQKNDPISTANGGRTTRSTTRKVRKRLKIEEGNENLSRQNSATSDDADDSVDSETHVVKNRIRISKKKAEPKLSVPPKKKKFKMKKRTSVGRWEPWEKLEFLRGLRRHGKGHWKKIGEAIPTRYEQNCFE